MSRRRLVPWLLIGFGVLLFAFWTSTRLIDRWVLGIPSGSRRANVLELRLSGPVVERPTSFWGDRLVGPLSLREIDTALRRAANDSRIEGVLLRVGPLQTGFAKAEEIRSALAIVRDAGKPIYALVEIGTLVDLYVAAGAERIYQIPSGNFLLGLVSRRQYYRDLLDSLGVEFEVFRTGPFKTAMSAYTDTEMAAEERAFLERLLDDIYDRVVDGIATGRSLEPAAVKAAIDEGIVGARRAEQLRLVDALGFEDELNHDLREKLGRLRTTSVRAYLRRSETSFGWLSGAAKIALIHVDGMMVPGGAVDGPFGDRVAGGETIARLISRARRDASVAAIVLRVDSPGGAVTAADVMWRETKLAAETKPVIVSMSDVAASGGYWIATAATEVYADASTYTGSIGVVMSRINLEGTYEKIGINNETITRGANAAIFVESSPLGPEQRLALETSVQQTYDEFLAKVADARGMTLAEVDAIGSGRVWTGQQALELNLVDKIGGLNLAVQAARRAAGIPLRAGISLQVYPESRSVFEQMGSLLTEVRMALSDQRKLSDALALVAAASPRSSLPPRLPGALTDSWLESARLVALLRGAGPSWALLEAPVPMPLR